MSPAWGQGKDPGRKYLSYASLSQVWDLALGKLRTDPNLLPMRDKGSLILFSASVLETPPFSAVYFILPFQTGFFHCASSTQTKLSRHWLQSQLKSTEVPKTHFHVFGFNTQRDPWFIFPETKEKEPLISPTWWKEITVMSTQLWAFHEASVSSCCPSWQEQRNHSLCLKH